MSSQITSGRIQVPPRGYRQNWIAFPKELREAIPDLHGGRLLEIDSLQSYASNTPLLGQVVHLDLEIKETGKLTGRFKIPIGLQPEAARQLAATLTRLADEAEQLRTTH